MAITNICGFETGAFGNDNEATSVDAGATIQTTTKRTGTYALKSNPVTTASANTAIDCGYGAGGGETGNIPTLYSRFYLNIAALPSASEIIFVTVGVDGVRKFAIRLDENGKLSAWGDLNSDTLLGGPGSTVLSTGTWYRLEAKVETGASVAWEVLINGTSELSGTGANLSTSNHRAIGLGKAQNKNGSGYECYFDDFACSDSAYPGAGECKVINPNANGNYTAWTGVFTDVDDLVSQAGNDGDTTKWTESTNLNAETAALESSATAGISGTINAVKTITVVKKTAAATTNIQHRLRVTSPSTSDTDLTNFSLSGSYTILASVRIVNPSGGAAWTTADIDTLEVGVEHNQSQSRQADCTMVCAMVDFTTSGSTPINAVPSETLGVSDTVAGQHNYRAQFGENLET